MTNSRIERIKWAKSKIIELYDKVEDQCNGHQNRIITDISLDELTKLCGTMLEIYMTLDDKHMFLDRCKKSIDKLEKLIKNTLKEMEE